MSSLKAEGRLSGVLARIKRPQFFLPVLIVVAAAVAISLLMATRPKLQPVVNEERVWPVEVVKVQRGDVQPMLELFGEVVSGRRSELRALVPGAIVAVGPNFREGAKVAKGELLVQIDPFEYENDVAEQKALLAEAEVRMRTVERDLKRIRELYDENNVSEQNLDDALLAVEQQAATLEQRRIGLARAARALKEARLTAPYAGVVNGVSADLGKQLSVNDKVAEVIDTGRLEVRFTLSNAQFGRILGDGSALEGRPVRVAWEVGNETLEFAATLARVGAEIDSTTGGVELYADIQSDAATPLRPGAFVWTRMPDRTYRNVFRAPDSALYGNDIVYVVRDARMEERRIEVVGYTGDEILFVPAGDPAVVDGDQVITTQIREGGAGIRVDVRT
ncbi:MAG: efflux RND transporter periplasmic adaptor subunit [Gammaproteobacteria bacterium]|jgi:RND family efflux transporter MFP subunit|nr:efflux RND transporter periplasmic adaptor subunit [Gammaproteobacteria bacterium]